MMIENSQGQGHPILAIVARARVHIVGSIGNGVVELSPEGLLFISVLFHEPYNRNMHSYGAIQEQVKHASLPLLNIFFVILSYLQGDSTHWLCRLVSIF